MNTDNIIAATLVDATNIKNDAAICIKNPAIPFETSKRFIKVLANANEIIQLLTEKLPNNVMHEVNKQIVQNEDNALIRKVAHIMAGMPMHQKKLIELCCEHIPLGGYSLMHKSEIEKIKNKK